MIRLALPLVLFVTGANAAPPVVTSLYPGGAKTGSTIEITATGTFARWPVQAWASDRSVSVKALETKGKLRVVVAADAKPGLCLIRLFDEEGPGAARPFRIGSLNEVNEQEPNDDVKKPQTVESSVVVNGRLEKPGDVDCFAVKMKKGQTLVADVEANETFGSPMDGVLQVVTPEGAILHENQDDHGLDPRLAFVAPHDGTYIVRLFAFPAVPDSSIRFAGGELFIYRLTLTTGAFADHAFPLAVSRKGPFEVDVLGWNLPQEARRLTLRPGLEEELNVFDPRLMRPFKVRIEAHPSLVEQEPNDRKRPQTLSLPVTVTGRIEPAGDVDVYRMEVKKGKPIVFQVESHVLGFPLDPHLRLTDETGKVLVEQDDMGKNHDPLLTYAPKEDGIVHLEVRDLHNHGGPRYVYRLRAGPTVPSFGVSVKPDRFTLTPGKPLEVPVTIERRAGHKTELEINAVDLPDGVTATLTRGQGASSTLKLEAKPGAASGAFRVSGREGEVSRFSDYLWLSISKKP